MPHPHRGPSSGQVLTPRKVLLRKRLHFVSNRRRAEKKRYLKRVRKLRANIDIQRVNQIKYLNQDIERKKLSMKTKDATITLLKRQIMGAKKDANLSCDAELFKRLKRTHKLLKDNQKKNIGPKKTVSKGFAKLKQELSAKDEIIRIYENDMCALRDKLEEVEKDKKEKETKRDGKTYSSAMRMQVYDAIVNMVPTQNIPTLIASYAKRTGDKLSAINCRTTVEQMARELDSLADLKTAEMSMKTSNLTLGFDATTQEHVHLNSIHFTTCEVVAIDELAGGTAADYCDHVCSSVDNLADVYADYHKEDYQFCRSTIIGNIANTMTDRVAADHAAISKVSEKWGKSLNELNCHLHPLDTMASSCRSALKQMETGRGELFGKDCLAGNLVLSINKFRYKAGKGDPKGFVTFLIDKKIPKGILPRYRGNRLHILYHICGQLHHNYSLFLEFFTKGTVSCGRLQSCIRTDFTNEIAKMQIQCLGLIGKLLTGPWMSIFYASSSSATIDHIEGIGVVKNVISELKRTRESPQLALTRNSDFFGRPLSEDPTLVSLQGQPSNMDLFARMMSACFEAIIAVLERQYQRYFSMTMTDILKEETSSARLHNIDAEEVMGMFGAMQERAKHASMDFLVARMRAKKNAVVPYLDEMYEDERERAVSWAIGWGRKKRRVARQKQSEVRVELSRRAALKQQKKNEKERKETEKKLHSVDIGKLRTEFPNISDETHQSLLQILNGTIVELDICHTWYDGDTNEQVVYSGRVEKLKKTKLKKCYVIAYWLDNESYEDATDYEMTPWALGADLLYEDLVLC